MMANEEQLKALQEKSETIRAQGEELRKNQETIAMLQAEISRMKTKQESPSQS